MPRLVLLILVFLILLLFLFVFLLLLLLLFLQFLQFLLHEVAVVFGVGVGAAELQRGLIRFHRLFPVLDGLLRLALLGLLAGAIKRVAEVVVSVLLRGEALGVGGRFASERFLKRLGCLRELAGFVGRRANVEQQIRFVRVVLCSCGILAFSRGKVSFLVGRLGCRGRGVRLAEWVEQQHAEHHRRAVRQELWPRYFHRRRFAFPRDAAACADQHAGEQ